jgi:hypothetical protein
MSVNDQVHSLQIPFSMSNYIPLLILPKCVMIHGEVVASVYIQIALNINHQKNCQNWKKNSFWQKTKTISNNIGYSPRVINNALKILDDLQLIKTVKQGKLNVYSLQNHQLKTFSELEHFNNVLKILLLSGMNKTKTHKYSEMFDDLENAIDFKNPLQSKYILSNLWFPDVCLLRTWIIQAEKIYKGSTLFFFNNVAPQIFNFIKTQDNNSLNVLSGQARALRIGSSQTTVTRYVNAFINSGCLFVEEGNVNSPTKLGINPDFLNNYENLEKRVVNCMTEDNNLVCPICNKEFLENRSLSVHLSKAKDPKHILLNNLKKQTNCKPEKLMELYLEYKEDFEDLPDEVENKQVQSEDYLNISCDCTMTCKECHRNWKLDYYNDCDHERKMAFIKEYNIEDKEVKKIIENENDSSKSKNITVVKEDFNIIKATKERKAPGTDTAPGLVKYFYGLTGGTSPNWSKEGAQVKNELKKGVTPEQVRITMDYLYRKGNIDLRFFNRSITEALFEKQCLDDTLKEGTEAYLVKMYYDGMKQPLNMQTLVRDVQRIKETMNSGLNYEQTKIVIEYMVRVKCPTLNFIGSKRTEALAQANKVSAMHNNPSFFDRDDIVHFENDLVNGRTRLNKIPDKYRSQLRAFAEKVFHEGSFTDKFTHFEWAWRIDLDLNDEMYQIALDARKQKESQLDIILRDPTLTPENRQKILMIKEKFEKWLNLQSQKFESVQSN